MDWIKGTIFKRKIIVSIIDFYNKKGQERDMQCIQP